MVRQMVNNQDHIILLRKNVHIINAKLHVQCHQHIRSTGNQYFISFHQMVYLLRCGFGYRKKYQHDPAHCGMVFVSRFAGPLHSGHVTFTHSVMAASGDSPVPVG